MLITTLTTITVCLHIHSIVAVQDYITNYQNITVSSVLQYLQYNYDPMNVVDQNTGTLPDLCECCWASRMESNPTITLLLQYPTVIGFIEILGRTDGNANQLLSGINILIDGQYRNIYQHYDRNNNKVTVRMPQEKASNITIHRPKTSGVWVLTICEVKAYRSDLKIIVRDIQNNSVYQSSTNMNNATSFGPQNAIDGKDNYDVDTCGCCSVTDNPGQSSWWHIDLGQQYLIQGIGIYGRSLGNNEQLQNAVIYAGNTSLTQNQHHGVKVYTVPTMNATTRHFTKILEEAIISQYLLVKLNETILVLCEFKLLQEVCDVGRFGIGCSHTCHCSDNKSCKTVTGECQTTGCNIGWNGTACDRECVSPTYGNNCENTCHCINGTHCDHVTGHCDKGQCDPGWRGETCSQECISTTYGNNCPIICHCINGTICDHVTGQCDKGQCDPGWHGLSCSQECVSPSYGNRCENICHCINRTRCDHVTGQCDVGQCDPGWQGESCSQAANLLYHLREHVTTAMSSVSNGLIPEYAINDWNGLRDPDICQCCSRTMNAQLSWWKVDLQNMYPLKEIHVYGTEGGRVINQLSGFSVYLANGTNEDATLVFTDKSSTDDDVGKHPIHLSNHLARVVTIQRFGTLTLCNVSLIEGDCKLGYFGDHCGDRCHCADRKPCNRYNGQCQSSVCKLGWTGTSCNTVCPSQTFGEDCNNDCFCKHGTCTKDYGICIGECQAGFKGAHCSEVCSSGTFGEGCTQTCYCKDATCAKDDGICPGGCLEGFEGIHCSKEVDGNTSVVIGKLAAIAGGCLGAVLVFILIVFYFIRRYT